MEKFIADAMLGKLAKYLRMFNIDTKYIKNINDEELMQIAKSENRIVLTRDRLLIKRKFFKTHKYIFIEGDKIIDQLKIFNQYYKLAIDNDLKYCLRCNNLIEEIEKEKIINCVPPFVFNTQKKFYVCHICNRIYWSGTHNIRMQERLKEILKKINEAKE